MFVIKYINSKTRTEYICDVVENYDILVTYFKKLMELNSSLKMYQPIPKNSYIGDLIPILESEEDEYCIERYEFVSSPQDNSSIFNLYKAPS